MVLFDTNVLCLLLHPDADIPNDPSTGKPIDQAQERINYLRDRLHDAGIRIVIPTPVLSEFLTFAKPDYLLQITQSVWFEVVSFDQRAAVEAALALQRAMKSAQGKKLGLASSWQKIKVDRQIVAIGKVAGVTAIYSTDPDVLTLARESGIEAIHVADLPLPPVELVQLTLEDIANQPSFSPPSESLPPSGQSLGDGQAKESQPAPVLHVTPQADPTQPQPGSSPGARKPPQSEQ